METKPTSLHFVRQAATSATRTIFTASMSSSSAALFSDQLRRKVARASEADWKGPYLAFSSGNPLAFR
jgi:hypothetical protein